MTDTYSTDTFSPTTEGQPAPMFATEGQPALSPNTEPNPAPIFDTGPHPRPLGSAEPAAPEPAAPESAAPESVEPDAPKLELAEWDSDEWRRADWRQPEPAAGAEPAQGAEPARDVEPAQGAEPAAGAVTPQPDSADLHRAVDALDDDHPTPVPQAFSELENVDTDTYLRAVAGHVQPVSVVAQPIAVASTYPLVKRWQFALIVAGVWLVAAAAGLGGYHWWYTALDKTLPVFGILLYLAVCMVASVLVSMVPNRPQLAALSVALMAAPLASTTAAAVLHGAYYFEWIARPVLG